MTHANSTRRSAYLRILDTEYFDPSHVVRATSTSVRAATNVTRADALEPGADWLSVFENELDDALADYELRRSDGRDTAELADYIAYLDACVAQMTADPRFAALALEATHAIEQLEAVAARRQIARG